MPGRTLLRDAAAGGLVAGVVSGASSTFHALVTGGDPWAATEAAGRMVLAREQRLLPLLVAAATVHGALSLGWAVPVALVARGRHPLVAGAAAGLGIAAFDLGVVGRRVPAIRALPQGPQVADHVAYGVAVAAVVCRCRASRRAVAN